MSLHFPSQKPRAQTGCQQRILFRDVCSRKFTEKAGRLNDRKKNKKQNSLRPELTCGAVGWLGRSQAVKSVHTEASVFQ